MTQFQQQMKQLTNIINGSTGDEHKQSSIPIWYWKTDNNVWIKYDDATCQKIENVSIGRCRQYIIKNTKHKLIRNTLNAATHIKEISKSETNKIVLFVCNVSYDCIKTYHSFLVHVCKQTK